MKINDILAGISRLAIDTAPLIYFIEAHPTYDNLVAPFFQQIDTGNLQGVTSVITLAEILSLPIQQGNLQLQTQYRTLLLSSAHFEVHNVDVKIAEYAAELRAKYRLRTPDALQVSTAISTGCQAILTNDKNWKRVTELQVIIVDELL